MIDKADGNCPCVWLPHGLIGVDCWVDAGRGGTGAVFGLEGVRVTFTVFNEVHVNDDTVKPADSGSYAVTGAADNLAGSDWWIPALSHTGRPNPVQGCPLDPKQYFPNPRHAPSRTCWARPKV